MKHLYNSERPYYERHKKNKLEFVAVGLFWASLAIGWVGLIVFTIIQKLKW